jgi:hypothetical protein
VRSVVGQLGRRPEWFRPTELLGEYDLHDLDPKHDPFKDKRREVMQPRQVCVQERGGGGWLMQRGQGCMQQVSWAGGVRLCGGQ